MHWPATPPGAVLLLAHTHPSQVPDSESLPRPSPTLHPRPPPSAPHPRFVAGTALGGLQEEHSGGMGWGLAGSERLALEWVFLCAVLGGLPNLSVPRQPHL